jgi:hypothetical protein
VKLIIKEGAVVGYSVIISLAKWFMWQREMFYVTGLVDVIFRIVQQSNLLYLIPCTLAVWSGHNIVFKFIGICLNLSFKYIFFYFRLSILYSAEITSFAHRIEMLERKAVEKEWPDHAKLAFAIKVKERYCVF